MSRLVHYDLILVATADKPWEFIYPETESEADNFNYLICTDGCIYKIVIKSVDGLNVLTDNIVYRLIDGRFYEEECILLDKIAVRFEDETEFALLLWPNDVNTALNRNSRAEEIVKTYSSYPMPVNELYGNCIVTFYCL